MWYCYKVNENLANTSNLIKFKYLNTEYEAEPGMTLTEWAESEYNTFGYYIEDNTTVIKENSSYGIVDYCANGNSCNIDSYDSGIKLENITENNIKKIYNLANYKSIEKTFGYLSRGLPLEINKIVSYANGLTTNQISDLTSAINELSSHEQITGPFFINIDDCKKDNSGKCLLTLRMLNLYKNMANIEILVFDELGTFSLQTVAVEDVDITNKMLTVSAISNSVFVIFAEIP